MKSSIMAGFIGAIIAVAMILLLSQLMPREAHAAATGGEQYKVITIPSKQQLEQELNRLGAEGWKVRSGASSLVILAK